VDQWHRAEQPVDGAGDRGGDDALASGLLDGTVRDIIGT
jgi:hypothetical protein